MSRSVELVRRVRETQAFRWNDWSMNDLSLVELSEYLDRATPHRIVELGTGASTAVIADYCVRTGAHAISLDQSTMYANRTRSGLREMSLECPNHQVIFAPLERASARVVEQVPDNGQSMIHSCRGIDWSRVAPADFVLIDGPTQDSGGRLHTFPHLVNMCIINDRATVWLDDYNRPSEKRSVDQWLMFDRENSGMGIAQTGRLWRGHGITQLSDPGDNTFDMSHVAITMTAGNRPGLLYETMRSLQGAGLLRASLPLFVAGLNDADPESFDILTHFVRGLLIVDTPTSRRPVGQAFTAAARIAGETVARQFPGVKYWFHLEDDWEVDTLSEWLKDAMCAVDVGHAQVRLRHCIEPTLTRNQITGESIWWSDFPHALPSIAGTAGFEEGFNAHFTLNPSLMPASLLSRFGRAKIDTERDAQLVFPSLVEQLREELEQGATPVARLTPGAFHHIGEGRSISGHNSGAGS